MPTRPASPFHANGSSSLVDGLARSVISKVNATPHQRRNRRIEIGAQVLHAAVLDPAGFDQHTVTDDLIALRITPVDIVDHCIPIVATELGAAWVADRLSFAEVTIASARLFSLCKSIGHEWNNTRPALHAKSLLLATMGREDHILGPAVLTDQLRRRGHSVHLLSNATGRSMVDSLRNNSCDGILISVATQEALEKAVEAITYIKSGMNRSFIVLGGVAVSGLTAGAKGTGADLVTNDIDQALDAMTGEDSHLRAAQ